jgi:FkbM family methyltransferase
MNLIPLIAICTRSLQATSPKRHIRGLTRFANLWQRWQYTGVAQFPDGCRMYLDNREAAERWLLFSGNYHPALTYTLQRFTKPGGYCLDVGANLGFYTVKLAHWVGVSGRVAAFEANPVMAARIQQNIELNHFTGVEVVEKAVHDHPETLEFNISSSPGKSSLLAIDNPVQRITVQAIPLDDYLKDWPHLDVIKMDIEGNDCRGLIGAQATIRRCQPVIAFEYRFDTPIEYSQPVFELFKALDYRVYELSDSAQLIPFHNRTQKGHTNLVCVPLRMTSA